MKHLLDLFLRWITGPMRRARDRRVQLVMLRQLESFPMTPEELMRRTGLTARLVHDALVQLRDEVDTGRQVGGLVDFDTNLWWRITPTGRDWLERETLKE